MSICSSRIRNLAIASVFSLAAMAGAQPHLLVSGNLVLISDGTTTPSIDIGTDLGSARTNGNGNPSESDSFFRLVNDGDTTLTLNPLPSLTGANASDFELTILDDIVSLLPGQVATMQLHFNPDGIGVRSAVVHISSDDPSAPDFDFAVQGTGISGQPNHDSEFSGQILKLPKVKCKTKDLVTTCRLSGQVVVLNTGGTTTSPQTLRFHLSADPYFDDGDEFIADVPVLKAIKAGKLKKVKYKFYLPPTPSGKNLIVNIDPDNVIPERFEHNNRVGTVIP